MPIRARVQRLWRLVVEWWRPSRSTTPQPAASTAAMPESATRSSSRTPRQRGPSANRSREGEPLIGGAITVRMWVIGGRLILGTSVAEAERAIRTLLPDLGAEEQVAARTLLETLSPRRAAAA